jgi:hypothetical protein
MKHEDVFVEVVEAFRDGKLDPKIYSGGSQIDMYVVGWNCYFETDGSLVIFGQTHRSCSSDHDAGGMEVARGVGNRRPDSLESRTDRNSLVER